MKNASAGFLEKYFAFGLFLVCFFTGALMGIVGGLIFACGGLPSGTGAGTFSLVIATLSFLTILLCRVSTKTISLLSVINGVVAGYALGFLAFFGLLLCLVGGAMDTIAGFKGIFGY